MVTLDRSLAPAADRVLTPTGSLEEAAHLADQVAAQDTFLRYRERKAPDTIRRHRADLDLFTHYLRAIPGTIKIGDLYNDPFAWHAMTKGLVEGFVIWQRTEGYAIGSINMRLSTVKLYCKLAQGAGALDEEHAAMIRTVMGYRGQEGRRIDAQRPKTRVGAKKAHPTDLTVAQARALTAQPDTPQGRRDRVLMCLLLNHGLRCEEVQLLQVSAFDLETGLFRFEQPKVGQVLQHRMTDATHHAVARYLAHDHPHGPLLYGSKQDGTLCGAMSKSAINQRVRFLGKKLGIDQLSPHDCRHFWAESAAQAGTDLESLKQAGGWVGQPGHAIALHQAA